jgi:hypothetical protein
VAEQDHVLQIVLGEVIDDRLDRLVEPRGLGISGRLPLIVGVKTSWPAARMKAATGSSSAPVCQAP